jgi:hypothetical protein
VIALFNLGYAPGCLTEALYSVLHNILVAVLSWQDLSFGWRNFRWRSFGWRSVQAFELRYRNGWTRAGNTFQWIVTDLSMFRRHSDYRRKL